MGNNLELGNLGTQPPVASMPPEARAAAQSSSTAVTQQTRNTSQVALPAIQRTPPTGASEMQGQTTTEQLRKYPAPTTKPLPHHQAPLPRIPRKCEPPWQNVVAAPSRELLASYAVKGGIQLPTIH